MGAKNKEATGENVHWCSLYGEQDGGSSKETKTRTTTGPCNPTPGHTPRENRHSQRHMHPTGPCSTAHSSQGLEAAWMSTSRGTDRDVARTYNGTLLRHATEGNSATCAAGDRRGGCHTVTEKSKRHIKSLYVGSEKWHRWSYLRRKQRHRGREQTRGCRGGKCGWDGLGDWSWHRRPPRTCRTARAPHSVLCGDPDGKEV